MSGTYERTNKFCKIHNIELIETDFTDGKEDYGYYCRKCKTIKLTWLRGMRK